MKEIALLSSLLFVSLAGVLLLLKFFSPAAREKRRRDRSHRKVTSTVNRPMVKFSVRSPDEKPR